MRRLFTIFLVFFTYLFINGKAQNNKNTSTQHPDSIRKLVLKARDFRNSGNFDSAFILANQAMNLSEKNNSHLTMAGALNIIGSTYEFIGKYDSAILMNNKALKICHQYKLDSLKAIVCNSLGNAYKKAGKYGNSMDAFYTALEIEERNANKSGVWRVLGNLTSLYKDLGDYQKSLETGLRSIEFAEQDSAKLMRSFINVGVSFFHLKNEMKAIEYTLQALNISLSVKNKDNEIICYINLGEYYLSLNHLEKARKYIHLAYTESVVLSNKPRILSSAINYALLMVELKKYDSAILFINKANTINSQINEKQRRVELNELMSKVYAGKNNFRLAYLYADSARMLNNDLKNQDVIKTIQSSISSYEVVKRENELEQIEADKKITEIELEAQKNLSIALFIFSAIVVFAAIVLYYLLQRIKKADQIIRQSNAELKSKNDIIEIVNAELTEKTMRNQLNPHFIFNCLNSIYYLLLKNNSEEAQEYLSKFSFLLRRILESVDKPSISLTEEIEIIKIYLKLESLRFDQSIQLNINVINLDTDEIFIPPLITQPIIENAVHHGLSKKNGEKIITIKVELVKGILQCSITDNGVGRSQNLKSSLGGWKESKGVKLTSTRLSSFNQNVSNHHIKTTDLFDDNNMPCGTQVEFSLAV